jgi:hypothetical protein
MESLELLVRLYGCPALFGGMVLEQFVPPFPDEPLLFGASALAGNGRLSMSLAFVLALGRHSRRRSDLVRGRPHRRATGAQAAVWALARAGHLRQGRQRDVRESWRQRAADREILAGLNSIGQPLAVRIVITTLAREGAPPQTRPRVSAASSAC